MFNLLVESTKQSRRRTPKYFLLTFLAYGSIMGAAVVGSIMFYSPALADTFDTIAMVAPQPPPAAGGAPTKPQSTNHPIQKYVSTSAPLTNENSVIQDKLPPNIEILTGSEVGVGLPGRGTGEGIGDGIGQVPGGVTQINAAPVPESIKITPAPEKKPDVAKPDNKIYKVSDGVKPGKAIYIPTLVYPVLAKQMHLEGQVKVEMVVDKTGRVISAVAVEGPALLRPSAVAAAQRSTFQPTYLSGEPVIVQAIFTFNFKLN